MELSVSMVVRRPSTDRHLIKVRQQSSYIESESEEGTSQTWFPLKGEKVVELHLDNTADWKCNTEAVNGREQSSLHLLRKLLPLSVCSRMWCIFSKSVLESELLSAVIFFLGQQHQSQWLKETEETIKERWRVHWKTDYSHNLQLLPYITTTSYFIFTTTTSIFFWVLKNWNLNWNQ